MKDSPEISPPRWATKLLSWYCRPALLEDLQGDLHEYFERNVKEKGPRIARLIYIIDVVKFVRPYTVRKPEFLNALIHWIMLGSYIRTSGRNIVRNKLFSAINIVGLSISMSVALLIIGMLIDLYSYDKFHANYERIYRVKSKYSFNGRQDQDYMATTSLRAAKAIKETFTGIDDVAVFYHGFSGDVTFEQKAIPLNGFWANESVLNVFSFPLLQGNPATALKGPFSIVLTEESALKMFGDLNVLGRTVVLKRAGEAEHREYTITGIMKNPPVFSHIKFGMLNFDWLDQGLA